MDKSLFMQATVNIFIGLSASGRYLLSAMQFIM